MIYEINEYLEKFLWNFGIIIVGNKLRYDFECSYFDDFVAIFGEI
jgi:hypothetical protein